MTAVFAPAYSLSDTDACLDLALAKGGPQLLHTLRWNGFWVKNLTDVYQRIISPSGSASVAWMLQDRRLTIAFFSTSIAVKSGINQINRLCVTAHGHAVILYVNGTRVAKITGQPPRGSQTGFTAWSRTNTREIYGSRISWLLIDARTQSKLTQRLAQPSLFSLDRV